MKKQLVILCLLAVSVLSRAQMNNPYVDDKIVHFGFSLGTSFLAYGVTDSEINIDGETYHARTSSVMPGFTVGFIADVRLSRHLNLRFLPNLNFGQVTVSYKTESGNPVKGSANSKVDVLSLPLALPLVLKWSAEREKNYRPYVLLGGGVSLDFAGQKERAIYQKMTDFFVTFGFGCDLYLEWFKLCPELRYQMGFNNVITPVEDRPELAKSDYFYTQAIKRLRNHMITLTFNFE
ncbi:MAG: PorT family protein [Paludibacteraceae bacterium]|nr:PorT family protein [Paludibacteraceae bacterium]